MNGVWILLGILKWIGIVLLGLLLLLFVILALVLLSPIRYRLSGQKDADMGGAFDVSYLWGAVRANGTYTPEQALRMKAKVLWFTVLGKEEKAETPPKEEKPKQEKAKASKEPKESRESKEPKETMEPTPLAAAEKTEEERPPKAVELPKAEKPKKTQGKTVRRVQLSEIEERPPTKEEMLTAEEEAFFTGEEAHIGTSEAERYTQGLAITTSDIGPPLGGSLQHSQCRGVALHEEQCLGGMYIVGKTGVVLNDAIVVGRSHEHASYITLGEHGLHGSTVGAAIHFGNEAHGDTLKLRVGFNDAEHSGIER